MIRAGERRELLALLSTASADLVAMDRLAQLEEKRSQPVRAASLEGKKAEAETRRVRYLKLYEREQHVRDAEEMAGLAEQLGRIFEARVFLNLAAAQEPEREDLRREFSRLAGRRNPAIAKRGQTLADVLGSELKSN